MDTYINKEKCTKILRGRGLILWGQGLGTGENPQAKRNKWLMVGTALEEILKCMWEETRLVWLKHPLWKILYFKKITYVNLNLMFY